MEQFSLEKYLENPTLKVVTRNGRNVKIVCTDAPNQIPYIYGFMETSTGMESWKKDGMWAAKESCNDLFFADEEEKLTEFEKEMIKFSHERNSLIQFEHTTEEINAHLHLYSEKLLDLARKEILKDFPEWKKITKSEQNYLAYGYLSHNDII